MGFPRQEYWSGLPALLQGIFPTQESNPGVPHCRWILYCLSRQGSLNNKFMSKTQTQHSLASLCKWVGGGVENLLEGGNPSPGTVGRS